MKKEQINSISDSELLRKMKKGDTDAFSILYHRHAPRLLNFVTGLLKDETAAEDVVQNIFVKLWTVRGQLDSSKSLTNWLFVCARNESYNVLKSAWHSAVDKDVVPSVETSAVEESVSFHEVQERLSGLVSNMPDRRKEIWRMSREQHLSNAEIARRLGISVRTVDKHLSLALSDIRRGFN